MQQYYLDLLLTERHQVSLGKFLYITDLKPKLNNKGFLMFEDKRFLQLGTGEDCGTLYVVMRVNASYEEKGYR